MIIDIHLMWAGKVLAAFRFKAQLVHWSQLYMFLKGGAIITLFVMIDDAFADILMRANFGQSNWGDKNAIADVSFGFSVNLASSSSLRPPIAKLGVAKEEKLEERVVVDEGVQVVSEKSVKVKGPTLEKEDGPGPRCGHTLTSVATVGEEGSASYMGPRLILFCGSMALERNSANAAGTSTSAGGAGIRIKGGVDKGCCHLHGNYGRGFKAGFGFSSRLVAATRTFGTVSVAEFYKHDLRKPSRNGAWNHPSSSTHALTHLQTSGSGNTFLLAVAFFFRQWEVPSGSGNFLTSSGNALCILFPTILP
nr:serine/threonine-protein phosphatase BSL3-like isoform X2 [Tanacetum cinerariifolium]